MLRVHRRSLTRIPFISWAFWLLVTSNVLQAGGGPENVFLVVNRNDADSKTVANHFARLRSIPDVNVYEMDWRGSNSITALKTFRNAFLEPIFKEIEKRKLTRQIDYIVYSAGLPYAVNIKEDFGENGPPREVGVLASITGMTYLANLVRAESLTYAQPQAQTNNYFSASRSSTSTRGFRSSYAWTRQGQRSAGIGNRYYLSTMLGYTAGRGNTIDEVRNYLYRAASADGIRPRGTIYYMKNADIRSRARDNEFQHAVDQLTSLGVNAQIINGDHRTKRDLIPTNRPDVMGASIGWANFSWADSGSRILPGAICEHFTSYGGVLRTGAGQTPLSEFLRHGAAGASGTVFEPRAIWFKFPHASIHVHYARGCTLAEAFFQSVASPYQLLVVGDPLCRPWAQIPAIVAKGVQPGDRLTGKVTITPGSRSLDIAKYQLYLDGRLRDECSPGETFSLDTTSKPDGFHELRIVGIDNSPIENQGRMIIPVHFDNFKRKLACRPFPAKRFLFGERVQLQVEAPNAREVHILHRRKVLAKMTRDKGTVVIDSKDLGTGTTNLTAIAMQAAGAKHAWFSDPIEVQILPKNSSRGATTVAPFSSSSPGVQ